MDRWQRLAVPGLLALVAALSAYRAGVIAWNGLPLFYDQVQYYYWALHPAWGYFSKPPVLAWSIALSTSVFGDSELAINLPAILYYAATTWLVYLLGRDLYDVRVGLVAGVLFIAMPLVGFNSLFVSTDAPLLLFWAATLWLFTRAVASGHLGWWLLTGLAAGLGLLSKYTMGVLAVGLLLHLLACPAQRRHLRDWRLWLGVALAAAVFAPNLWWNLENGFASIRHTAEISQLDRAWLHPGELLAFLAAQFGVFGPVTMALLVMLALRRDSYGDCRSRLLWYPALAMLGVIATQALLSRAFANWAAPAFVTGSVIVAAWLVNANRRRLLVAAVALNLALLSVLYHYHALAGALGVTLEAGQTPYKRVLGWRELGAEISRFRADEPSLTLLGNSRRLLSYAAYSSAPRTMALAWWGPGGGPPRTHYQLVADISQTTGQAWLYVGTRRLTPEELARFESHRYLGQARVTVMPGLERSAEIYHLAGFLGY